MLDGRLYREMNPSRTRRWADANAVVCGNPAISLVRADVTCEVRDLLGLGFFTVAKECGFFQLIGQVIINLWRSSGEGRAWANSESVIVSTLGFSTPSNTIYGRASSNMQSSDPNVRQYKFQARDGMQELRV